MDIFYSSISFGIEGIAVNSFYSKALKSGYYVVGFEFGTIILQMYKLQDGFGNISFRYTIVISSSVFVLVVLQFHKMLVDK